MRLTWLWLGAGAVQAAFTLITLAAAVLVSQSVYLGLVWQVRRPPARFAVRRLIIVIVRCPISFVFPLSFCSVDGLYLLSLLMMAQLQVVKFATPVYYGARKSIGSALR